MLHVDAGALARVEEIIAAQQALPIAPWQPVTDYSREARMPLERRQAELIKQVFGPRTVLDVGCGFGYLLDALQGLGIAGRGVDVSAPDNWTIHDRVWNLDIAAIDGPEWFSDLVQEYLPSEVVVCREVLEHLPLTALRRAVTNLCDLSRRFVFLTTRFCTTGNHVFDVDTHDDLDPTHITMLTQPMLRYLFVLEGFKRRQDLEEAMDWMKKGRVLVYERA